MITLDTSCSGVERKAVLRWRLSTTLIRAGVGQEQLWLCHDPVLPSDKKSNLKAEPVFQAGSFASTKISPRTDKSINNRKRANALFPHVMWNQHLEGLRRRIAFSIFSLDVHRVGATASLTSPRGPKSNRLSVRGNHNVWVPPSSLRLAAAGPRDDQIAHADRRAVVGDPQDKVASSKGPILVVHRPDDDRRQG